MPNTYEVEGTSATALFTLKVYRGEGACLLAMNWKSGEPTKDFVGFAIEYQPPGSTTFRDVPNRLAFPQTDGEANPATLATRLSPIQKFRWVHFPPAVAAPGDFVYRVTPVFMDPAGKLSYGDPQQASIDLQDETYPGELNVAFTRGFVSSQAFVDRFESAGDISTLLPAKADDGLKFKPTHPKTKEALNWMGFEAARAVLSLLDEALKDPSAKVKVVAYDLNEPDVVARLEELGSRLQIIIDDSGSHQPATSAESQAAKRLTLSAGKSNVRRQHMGNLQHNKMIVADGDQVKAAIGGSTNFSWRAFFVQANNALIVRGAQAIAPFAEAFDHYWSNTSNSVTEFAKSGSAVWLDMGLANIDAKISFSPHSKQNAMLAGIAKDIAGNTQSSLFYSLAFLYQTKGAMQDAIKGIIADPKIFSYGISDKQVKDLTTGVKSTEGIDLQTPDGNVVPVWPSMLTKNVPEPFKSEPTGGGGTRMHHKFVVIDFNTDSARVYLGSYNFSSAADTSNGENLMVIRDRKVATSYMVEALRLFDHNHFRVIEAAAKNSNQPLELALPPKAPGDTAWWEEDYTDPRKKRDRELFA